MHLKGLYTAVITPFTTQGKLDEEGFKSNLQFQLHHGVDGIVVLGTTGESPTLTAKEKQRVVEIAVQEVKGKAVLMVGTGSYSTEQAIEQTCLAEQMGADAALIVTPYYNKPTQEGLYRHFAAICQSTPLPICIYNIQGRTGQNLQTATLKRIAAFSSIMGVKEASGDIIQMNEVLDMIAKDFPHFSVVSGDDALTLPLIALGGQGVISVASNLVPGAVKALVHAGLEGNFKLAREWHYRLLPFFKAAFIETNPIPIKTAMSLCRMPAGSCRLPLCDLLPQNYEKLAQVVKQLPEEWIAHG
ncbi:4-hydroxy-tetrahydrodipicolinate synthase [Candidatus Protochlamydia phocaeensis]|uniref:4-hydroxy-tetrahydrodipicolinate synthase n=1 Tax=Candidatus Protochlamydia phocaeensis TaxID=1414722 RepID=UPI0008387FAA|nr:4-hydroxy-tetrahydrodipicolinate synthase [Candidatus Protochlamydia phocaeensis]